MNSFHKTNQIITDWLSQTLYPISGSSMGEGVTPRHVTRIVLGLMAYTLTAFGGMSGGKRHVRSER